MPPLWQVRILLLTNKYAPVTEVFHGFYFINIILIITSNAHKNIQHTQNMEQCLYALYHYIS